MPSPSLQHQSKHQAPSLHAPSSGSPQSSPETYPVQFEQAWTDVNASMKSFVRLWDIPVARHRNARTVVLKTIDAINAQRTVEVRLCQMHSFTRMLEEELGKWSDKLDTAKQCLETLGPEPEPELHDLHTVLFTT
ncbi:hypothetical protein BDN67DRAFT_1015182 [Paxillus ammoniavirescens]|nr:hypothetical protein BDN67DRAFT_1015182 [Paxillus ammoniavirescens]